MTDYGKELILDLYECDPTNFTRACIKKYFEELCNILDMQRCDLHFWDDIGVVEEDKQTEPHLKGTSAIQFIMTSNITIHTLDMLGKVYINIFSCKDFDAQHAKEFSVKWFGGKINKSLVVGRI